MKQFELTAGNLCLDFANTVHDYGAGNPRDDLENYGDLVDWGHQAGILSRFERRQLLAQAARRREDVSATLSNAKHLRHSIYRIFSAIAGRRPPEKAELAALNRALSEALARAQVVPGGSGFIWKWAGDAKSLDRIVWPVSRSAAELLTSDSLTRTRECSGETCTWLFIDSSKNATRRWCDMAVCGNRAKSRRHYERQRQNQKR